MIFWGSGSVPFFCWKNPGESIRENGKSTGHACFVYRVLFFLTESAKSNVLKHHERNSSYLNNLGRVKRIGPCQASRLCEQRRFRRAYASAQSRQNLRCSLIQAVSQEELSDRKPDPFSLWMAGHAQLKFFMTECSKTQIRLTRHL